MWIFQEEIVPSPSFCWYRGEGDGTTVCDSLINKWGRCGLDETGIGWKTGCTVSKFVRNSQPEREVMANRDLSLLLLCLQFEGGQDCFIWCAAGRVLSRTEARFIIQRDKRSSLQKRPWFEFQWSCWWVKAAGAGSQWRQGRHPGCAGSQEIQRLGGFCAVLQHRWGLAGDSPKGTVKITRGGWDVTSAEKPERMVRGTEEMQRVLKHGAQGGRGFPSLLAN